MSEILDFATKSTEPFLVCDLPKDVNLMLLETTEFSTIWDVDY